MIGGEAERSNAFAVELYRVLATRPGNVFAAPASVATALAIAAVGAREATAEELRRVFHWGEETADTKASARWEATGQLALANRLFTARSLEFTAAFLAEVHARFAAPLELLNFASMWARERINTWVTERTGGKITELLPPGAVDEKTRMVLVNAVHFMANWEHEFQRSDTQSAPFHTAQGVQTVPMMTRTGVHRLASGDGVTVLDLPYVGGTFAATFVLPDARDGLAAIERELSAETIRWCVESYRLKQVTVKLPRFRIEPRTALALSKPLGRLGLVRAFSERHADFSGVRRGGNGGGGGDGGEDDTF